MVQCIKGGDGELYMYHGETIKINRINAEQKSLKECSHWLLKKQVNNKRKDKYYHCIFTKAKILLLQSRIDIYLRCNCEDDKF